MSVIELKKELKKLDKDKLIALICDLYKNNKSVKEHLDFFVDPNEIELHEKYREKIYESFYTKRGDFNLSKGKKALSDFKKLAHSPYYIADLTLYYVETGVSFTNDFGDIHESFYNSLESTFATALKLMQKEGLLNDFADRAKKVESDTEDIGWGFHDSIGDIYYTYYED